MYGRAYSNRLDLYVAELFSDFEQPIVLPSTSETANASRWNRGKMEDEDFYFWKQNLYDMFYLKLIRIGILYLLIFR